MVKRQVAVQIAGMNFQTCSRELEWDKRGYKGIKGNAKEYKGMEGIEKKE